MAPVLGAFGEVIVVETRSPSTTDEGIARAVRAARGTLLVFVDPPPGPPPESLPAVIAPIAKGTTTSRSRWARWRARLEVGDGRRPNRIVASETALLAHHTGARSMVGMVRAAARSVVAPCRAGSDDPDRALRSAARGRARPAHSRGRRADARPGLRAPRDERGLPTTPGHDRGRERGNDRGATLDSLRNRHRARPGHHLRAARFRTGARGGEHCRIPRRSARRARGGRAQGPARARRAPPPASFGASRATRRCRGARAGAPRGRDHDGARLRAAWLAAVLLGLGIGWVAGAAGEAFYTFHCRNRGRPRRCAGASRR